MSDDVDGITKLWSIEEGEAKPSATIHELKPPKKEQPTGKPSYEAFTNKDKVYAFTIVSQSPRLEYSFFYQNLVQLVVNAPEADFLSVMTSSAFIRITGRNLKPIATALKMRTCDTITQYSPELFLPPDDNTAPFIESVEVTTPDPQPAKKLERGSKPEVKREKQEA
ncbi:MAG: hypothetical protein JSR29_13310 [Nitrospira sp.]|nr:hypothetical protein [Nitrospira sp.]